MKATTKKTTKRERVIESIMKRDHAEKEMFHGRTIITHSPAAVAIWEYKTGYKPTYHYKFATPAKRLDFINERKARILVEVENEKRYLEIGTKEKEKIKVGTIMRSSWGYEQTNIDYYKVISKKKDFVILVEIADIKEYTSSDCGTCMPDESKEKGEMFRKKITKHGTVNLNSFSHCGVWDGTKDHFTSYA